MQKPKQIFAETVKNRKYSANDPIRGIPLMSIRQARGTNSQITRNKEKWLINQ